MRLAALIIVFEQQRFVLIEGGQLPSSFPFTGSAPSVEGIFLAFGPIAGKAARVDALSHARYDVWNVRRRSSFLFCYLCDNFHKVWRFRRNLLQRQTIRELQTIASKWDRKFN